MHTLRPFRLHLCKSWGASSEFCNSELCFLWESRLVKDELHTLRPFRLHLCKSWGASSEFCNSELCFLWESRLVSEGLADTSMARMKCTRCALSDCTCASCGEHQTSSAILSSASCGNPAWSVNSACRNLAWSVKV